MKVSDLKPNTAVDKIELDVEEVGEARIFRPIKETGRLLLQ